MPLAVRRRIGMPAACSSARRCAFELVRAVRAQVHDDAHLDAGLETSDELVRVARIFHEPEADVDADPFSSDVVDQNGPAVLCAGSQSRSSAAAGLKEPSHAATVQTMTRAARERRARQPPQEKGMRVLEQDLDHAV